MHCDTVVSLLVPHTRTVMIVCQSIREDGRWSQCQRSSEIGQPDLIFCFGDRFTLTDPGSYAFLYDKYPNSQLVVSSTAGEISNDRVLNGSIVATALRFEKSSVVAHSVNIQDYASCEEAAAALSSQFEREGMKLFFVLSDGQLVNGSLLVEGLNLALEGVPIVGGMAGDGDNFQHTIVGLNKDVRVGNIVGVALYGEHLRIGIGSRGGWDKFGPPRTITKAEQNVLYEIDHENALDLYRKYLGHYAEQLPSSALLFPLAIQEADDGEIVRTILNIDVDHKSMIFAGNIPNNAKVRLMRSNLDNLVTAASDAAELCVDDIDTMKADLAIMVSCVGRKMIFGSRIDEEVEAARDVFGSETVITGFYSYGEIAPFSTYQKCELHNQTMTITTISEV